MIRPPRLFPIHCTSTPWYPTPCCCLPESSSPSLPPLLLGHGRRVDLLRPITPSYPASNDTPDIEHKGDAGYYRVRDDVALGRACELQAKSAIDDAEDHEKSSKPDVDVADNSSLLVLDKVAVVRPSQERLKAHESNDDGAHLRMALLPPLFLS